MSKKLVITIEREYGSGGRMIGKALSEKLGIPYYDDDILVKASEQSAVGEQYFRMNDEKPGNNLLYRIIGGVRNSLDKPTTGEHIASPDNLFKLQSAVIRGLAEEAPCILIGRCSDFVLESAENIDYVSLFVYADLPAKIKRTMDVDGIDTKTALDRIQKTNKKRSNYYRYYTGNDWDDMTHYDMPINTTELTIDQSVELILHYLKLRGYEI